MVYGSIAGKSGKVDNKSGRTTLPTVWNFSIIGSVSGLDARIRTARFMLMSSIISDVCCMYRYVGNNSTIYLDTLGSVVIIPPIFVPKPKPDYGDDPSNTDYCYACRVNQVNDCYPQHCYIQVGGLDEYGLPLEGTEGFGIAPGQKEGYSPNNPEHSFRPSVTIPLCRDNNLVLQYGPGKGKKGGDATIDDIKNCLDSIPARMDYVVPGYTCWTWASEAPGKCGLGFCGKKEKHNWPPSPPSYEVPKPERPGPPHRPITPPRPKPEPIPFWPPPILFA